VSLFGKTIYHLLTLPLPLSFSILAFTILETTTATLVAKEAGRDLLEFNASDARSKKALQNQLGNVGDTESITSVFRPAAVGNKKQAAKQLKCVIMDEVDGMGGGDRSGMAELIQMIKHSKVPIICICNDRQSQKMKSLVPYCLDLRFKRPVKSILANRAIRIAEMEGLTVERNAAEAIAESCGNDVRQVFNCLQMWANKQTSTTAANHDDNTLTYKGLKEREHSINKDEILRVSLFDAAKTIMEGRRNLMGANSKAEVDSLFKRADAFFVDYSMVGLLVQQNYPKVMQGEMNNVKRSNDPHMEATFLERMHDAAMSMSDYAMAEHSVRGGDQNWSLLPASGIMCVKTGYHAGGPNGGMLPGFPEFTAWMGKNSTKGKKMRLLQELQQHLNFKISGGTLALRESYLPVFRQHFLTLFQSKDEGATKEAIELMDEYGLSRDDIMEKLDEFKMSNTEKGFADLDSKQKAAITREYNQGVHTSQALVWEQGGAGSKRGGGANQKGTKDPADLDAIDEDVAEEESDNDDEEEDLKKLQEKFKKKGRKTSSGGGGAATKKQPAKGGVKRSKK
jgi:replication factor C subunit 1